MVYNIAMHVFVEISFIVVIAALVSVVVRLLKQPLIVGYIVTGIICGPYVLNILHTVEVVEIFSKFGIAMLLFIVGLHMSPRVIQEVGKISVATGLLQVVLTTAVGFGISLFLGIDRIAAIYIAIALTFSSTIIILKLLSDKGDIHKLYGKITIGFLLVQDIIASVVLILIASFDGSQGGNIGMLIGLTLVKGLSLTAGVIILSSYILPRLYRYISTSQELLFLCSIAWGLGIASLFSILGFSVEIGALVAGVTVSTTPYANEVGSRLKPLRDFFVVLFFILLGSQMVISNIQEMILPALVLSLFVLVGNPVIVIIIMNLLGYNRRTVFYTGLAIAQISEFSLILATLGFELGHLSREILSLITVVGLITIAGSTYLILYSDALYKLFGPWMRFLELNKKPSKGSGRDKREYTTLLFGYDRVGAHFIKAFQKIEQKTLVIDFNPESIAKLQNDNILYEYGDAEDVEFLNELDLAHVTIAVSTIPEFKTSCILIDTLRKANPKVIIIVISHTAQEAKELYHRGATYVIMPHYLGAQYAAQLITKNGTSRKDYEAERGKHMTHLYKKYLHK